MPKNLFNKASYLKLLIISIILFGSQLASASSAHVTDIRWGNIAQADDRRVIRIVLELSGSYDVNTNYSQISKTNFSINGLFKNLAISENVARTTQLSDDMALDCIVQSVGNDLKMQIDLAKGAQDSYLNVFLVKEDRANNKPWRIVVDVIRKTSVADVAPPVTYSKITLSEQPIPRILATHWSNVPDIGGTKKVRVVCDLSGPYRLQGGLKQSGATRDQLQANLAGLGISSDAVREINVFDGNTKRISFQSVNNNSIQLTAELARSLPADCYNLFVLRDDPQHDKPWRLVIDIYQPVLQGNVKFTVGLKGKTICIDPGHGGSDTGAIGPGGVYEKNVTLPIALQLKMLLEHDGCKVYMTRQDDRDVYAPDDTATQELQARVDVSAACQADIFVCIHADAFTNPGVNGTATYYYPKTSYDGMLASSIQNSELEQLQLNDRGVNRANFYVLKHTTIPAVLLEVAFISNPDEEKMLTNMDFQNKVAIGMEQGIEKFFSNAALLN